MKRKLLIFIAFIAHLAVAQANQSLQQRRDIESLLSEVTYLIEVTQEMQNKYAADNSKVRFNYVALIQQLEASKSGIQEYLNLDITELHNAPNPPVKTQMVK